MSSKEFLQQTAQGDKRIEQVERDLADSIAEIDAMESTSDFTFGGIVRAHSAMERALQTIKTLKAERDRVRRGVCI